MTLVECVRCEFFPVGPYFVEYFRVVSVFLTAFKEQGLQLVHFFDKLLTHCLAQRVALSACEVGEQTRK